MPPRVLLIYPPSHLQRHTDCPPGLLYLGAVLESSGYEVRAVDANAALNPRSAEEIVSLARDFEPDVIGMTIVTQLAREAYRLASLLRIHTGARLIAGGPHPSMVPQEPLRFGFDAVCVGEGEPVIAEAVTALAEDRDLTGVPGLVYRDDDDVIRHNSAAPVVEELDALPAPARHLVSPQDFRPPGSAEQFGDILSSRGCPCRCSYCAGGLFGRRFRFRSPEHVLQEIARVSDSYGTRVFHFVDDGMTVKRSRAVAICEGIRSLNRGINWSMMTRIDRVDPDLLALAAASGCIRIDYGVESGHPETLKRIHKRHTVEMSLEIVKATRRAGITPMVFFIVGFPWETAEHIDATLSVMKQMSPYLETFYPALASILIPFPGTELYDQFADEYDLREWWLRDEYAFGVPKDGRHAFFEQEFFRVGSVLDANFFRYSPAVRNRIYRTFRFMHEVNNRRQPLLSRLMNNGLVDLSRTLHRLSPAAERALFDGLMNLHRRLAAPAPAAHPSESAQTFRRPVSTR